MATVGGNLYATPVFTFFDALRSYDVETACSVLAEDADLHSPWNDGVLTGKEGIQGLLEKVLGDAKTRPSFTIDDIRGDGNIIKLDVSMSNRFGRAPEPIRISCLHLHGLIHHVVIEGRDRKLKLPVPDVPMDTEE